MIKIFLISLFFLIIEIHYLEIYLADLVKYDMWKIDFKNNSQRRAFKIINDILLSNNEQNIYAFGGSSSREFYSDNNKITKDIKHNFYNCAISNQTPFDSLKLQTLIKPNDIIIYGIHPKSLQDPAFGEQQIIDGYYFGGQYFKYPLNTDKLPFIENINNNNLTVIHKIFPLANTYMYLLKEYVKKHSFKEILELKLNTKIPKQYNYLGKKMSYQLLEDKLNKWKLKSKNTANEHLILNFKLIEKMIILSQKNKTKFVLLELPFSPIIIEYFKNDLDLYYKNISKLIKKYPNIIFISNDSFKKAQQDLFYDSIHLLPKGREYYSKDVNSILNRLLDD